MANPIIYITRGQISDEFEVKRRHWYRTRHATDVVSVGFLSARGYRSPTAPQNVNVYELPSVDVLAAQAYMDVRKADTFSPTVMKEFTYLSASLYTQMKVKGPSGDALDQVPTIRGPVLDMVSFDATGDQDGVPDWFERSIVGPHRNADGIRTIRLWEQRDAHPLFPPKEPRWCVALEWAHDPGAAGAGLREAVARAPIPLDNIRAASAMKWYGLVREDVFEQ